MIMARTIRNRKIRRAIAVAYNMSVDCVSQELVDDFINYRKAA